MVGAGRCLGWCGVVAWSATPTQMCVFRPFGHSSCETVEDGAVVDSWILPIHSYFILIIQSWDGRAYLSIQPFTRSWDRPFYALERGRMDRKGPTGHEMTMPNEKHRVAVPGIVEYPIRKGENYDWNFFSHAVLRQRAASNKQRHPVPQVAREQIPLPRPTFHSRAGNLRGRVESKQVV